MTPHLLPGVILSTEDAAFGSVCKGLRLTQKRTITSDAGHRQIPPGVFFFQQFTHHRTAVLPCFAFDFCPKVSMQPYATQTSRRSKFLRAPMEKWQSQCLASVDQSLVREPSGEIYETDQTVVSYRKHTHCWSENLRNVYLRYFNI